MVNKVKFKDLHRSYPSLLREELLPSAKRTPEVFYKVNYQALGSLLIQDLEKDGSPNFEGPRVQSSIGLDV